MQCVWGVCVCVRVSGHKKEIVLKKIGVLLPCLFCGLMARTNS